MKKAYVLGGMLFLTACTTSPISTPTETLDNRLQNPLFAERYYEDLVQRMVELEIGEHPVLSDPAKKRLADAARREGLKQSREAEQKQLKGTFGSFTDIEEFTTGNVLYVDNMLYTDPSFETHPGVHLRLYLTTVVDPRDSAFPDETAMDIGRLESPYGAQQYPVPEVDDMLKYRTVVLFDDGLERLHGFAQLSPF